MTKDKPPHWITLITTAACAMLGASPVLADEQESNRTLRAGPDVWRIELHDADYLSVSRTGDSYKPGELRWITWRLISGDQYHHSKLKGRELQVVGRRAEHKGSYVSVRPGDSVSARVPIDAKGRQLWVHAQQFDSYAGSTQVSFELEIGARDLDCARNRVCRRGSTGRYRISVYVDLPPVRSTKCIEGNTLRLGYATNGRKSGLLRQSIHPQGKPEALSFGTSKAPPPAWGGIVTVEESKNGPVVLPSQIGVLEDVSICIASTA